MPKVQPIDPHVMRVGGGFLHVTTQDFVNGYEFAQKSYQSGFRDVVLTETELSKIILDQLDKMRNTEQYNLGYCVGFVASFATKEQPCEAILA